MRWLRVFMAAGGVVLSVWALLAWVVDRAGTGKGERYHVDMPELIVGLGARVDPDGSPSPTLRARVELGVQLLNRSPRNVLLFSGGVGRFGASEASVARDLAIQLGVPASRCLVEEESHSTVENVAFSLKLVRKHHPGHHVMVVSDPYRLLRAGLLFERIGGEKVSVMPVLNAPRHRAFGSRALWAFREVPAIAKDLLITW